MSYSKKRDESILKTELDKLEQEYQTKRDNLIRENEITEKLQPIIAGYHPPMIHFHKLYGSVGSIHIHGTDYDSLRKGKQPDSELLNELLKAFPPIPRLRVKDGCTSFQPETSEKIRDKADLYECHGVIVRVETMHSPKARFEWYSQLNGQIWEFSIAFPFHRTDLGDLVMRAKRWPDGKIIHWEECRLSPRHDAQVIRWASGGSEYSNDFTLYWDRDSGKSLNFGAIAQKEVRSA